MAQFVTAQQVIDNAFTQLNTDPSLIRDQLIEQSQLKHIRPILGEDLYDLIVAQNNASSLTVANQYIFDNYIQKSLWWFVKYDVIADIQYKTGSKGITIPSSLGAAATTENAVTNVMIASLNTAISILERMTEYIEENLSDYPTYNSGDNPLNDTTIRNGIIL
jgi:hypothetical protein